MEETRLDSKDWDSAVFLWVALLCLVAPAFTTLELVLTNPRYAPFLSALVWVWGLALVLLFLWLHEKSCARTLLTPERIEFRSRVYHSFIAWEDVTGIEKYSTGDKGGVWWRMRICYGSGRRREVPGVPCKGDQPDERFAKNFATLENYWAEVSGRTAPEAS